jgi:hypothetical protein
LKLVKTDADGRFVVDLPLGYWAATTVGMPSDPPEHSLSRPRHFRLTKEGRLTLPIYLRPPVFCSLMIVTSGGRPATPGEISERDVSCWGEKSFPVPSGGVPLEVNLSGLENDRNACSRQNTRKSRQSATYNLLSLEADSVTYYPNDRVLEAQGNVAIENESGHQKAASIKFRIVDGWPQQIP